MSIVINVDEETYSPAIFLDDLRLQGFYVKRMILAKEAAQEISNKHWDELDALILKFLADNGYVEES